MKRLNISRVTSFLILLFLTAAWSYAQVPNWYYQHTKNIEGIWRAEHPGFKDPENDWKYYFLEWKVADDRNYISGIMYGMTEGRRSEYFWEFHRIWDPEKQAIRVVQIGPDGTIGRGYETSTGDHTSELVQEFEPLTGPAYTITHLTEWVSDTVQTGTAFQGKGEKKKKMISMTWTKLSPAKRVISVVDSSDSGNLTLIQSFEVRAPIKNVWEAYTTSKSWEEWGVSHAEIDLKNGGVIRTQYKKEAKIGDPGTIDIQIVNYLPEKLLTLQTKSAENFPDFAQKDVANMYNVITFEKLGPERTRVVSYGIGYRNTPKYKEMLGFFIQANEETTEKMINYIESQEMGPK